MFTIDGHPTYRRASSVNRAVLYTASECTGCFSREQMHHDLVNLAPGESITYPALRFVGGPSDPPPIVITRDA